MKSITGIILGVSLAVGAWGCLQPPDGSRVEVEAKNLVALDGGAPDIAQHPAFAILRAEAFASTAAGLELLAQKTRAELEALHARVEDCQGLQSLPTCADLAPALAPVTPSPKAAEAGRRLREAFHLEGLTPAARIELVRAALAAGPPPSDEEIAALPKAVFAEVACTEPCIASLLSLGQKMQTFTMAMLVGGEPSGGGGGFGEWVAKQLIEAAIECLLDPDCFVWNTGGDGGNDGPECTSDGDCDSDEYCWTGVVGIGTNECRPKKSNGQTCSRGGQCSSGCCKYKFFVNPVSSTCRPSSDCN